MLPKLYLGTMSKNIVASIIRLNSEGFNVGMIPSRRQIDFMGGYVGWNTSEFSNYVWSHNINITLCRDHAGPIQGTTQDDDGIRSLMEDRNYFDIIHIDPWKLDVAFQTYKEKTVELMKICYERNPRLLFEIGTEEGIKHLSTEQLFDLIKYVKDHVNFFDNVKYAVIQSGTNLRMNENTGIYNSQRLLDMVEMVHSFGMLTKEHNGDYLNSSVIVSKFDRGLDAINIAPEIGGIETECYLNQMNAEETIKFFDLCYKSNQWIKWTKGNLCFDPMINKEKIVKVCGHYVFSNREFVKMTSNIDIKEELYQRIKTKVTNIIGK